MPPSCKTFLASDLNQFLCIRFSFVLIAVGFSLLLYYGITVVLPAAKTRDFQETTCFVNFSAFDGVEICDCGGGFPLTSCYPCFKIHVYFSTEKNEMGTQNASMRGQQSILFNDVGSLGGKCAFRPPSCCSSSKEENIQQVLDFMEENGRNASWTTCYYNKFNQTEVIATRGNYQLSVFMSLFWPLLVIIVGCSLMKYVKHVQPGKVKTRTTQDRRRILVLSTMTAFLRSEGQPAAYLMSASRNNSLV